MIIQANQISSQALDNLISEYCLRDWGLNDIESPLETRIQQVKTALDQGTLVILFSEDEECAHITSATELKME